VFECCFIGFLPNYMNMRGIPYLRVLLLCKFGIFGTSMRLNYVVLIV